MLCAMPEALEEGGVAFQPADKARIHFQVIEAQIVQQADLAEPMAEVFKADAAAFQSLGN